MKKKHNNQAFTVYYGIILVINLLTFAYLPSYFPVARALVSCSLIGYYIYEVRQQAPPVLLGLIGCLLGDVFILFGGGYSMLVISSIAYLIMTLGYASAIRRSSGSGPNIIVLLSGIAAATACTYSMYTWSEVFPTSIAIIYILMLFLVWKSSLSSHIFPQIGGLLIYYALGGLYLVALEILPKNGYLLVLGMYIIGQFLMIKGFVDQAGTRNKYIPRNRIQ